MRSASFRFHGHLRDFLRRPNAVVEFELPAGVRDLIQGLGVPHVEIGSITVDGSDVDFAHVVDDGADVQVFDRFDRDGRPASLHPVTVPDRFVLDVHLGRLAGYLRLLGFDSLHHTDFDDDTLVAISLAESRTLLTRDLQLLMRAELEHAVFVRSQQPRCQLVEIVERLGLRESVRPFERCMACNGLLTGIRKQELPDRVPKKVRTRHDHFTRCTACRRVYWQGSHYQRLLGIVDEALGAQSGSGTSR